MPSRFDHRFDMAVIVGAGDVVSIQVEGDLDRSSVSQFEQAVRNELMDHSHVVADVSAASVMESAALAALVRSHRLSEECNALFQVLIGPEYQQQLFDIAGLTQHLNLVRKPPATAP